MGEADPARARGPAAADETGVGDEVVGRAEGTTGEEGLAIGKEAGNGGAAGSG
jgi:hypothetical protein